MAPPLITPEELGERYPALLADKLVGAVAAASALVRSYATRAPGYPNGWVADDGTLSPVPDGVVEATYLVARRAALMSDSAAQDETAGPFSVRRDSSVWLSGMEKIMLKPWSDAGGYRSITTTGPLGTGGPLLDEFVPSHLASGRDGTGGDLLEWGDQ